jgi:hypothetical protein
MRAVLLSGLVTAALVLVAVGVFELSLERAAVLAGLAVAVLALLVGLSLLGVKLPRE